VCVFVCEFVCVFVCVCVHARQVRFAASVAARAFFRKLGPVKEPYLPLLVPPMCLNRYYVAEGVRSYSQATWAEVVGTDGPAVVASVIEHVVRHYIQQSNVDNYAVREAACHCIAELAHKARAAPPCVLYYVLVPMCL
jgi:hypothetical protein